MKAAQISEYGHADVVKINEAIVPVPAADQVLVEVHASSLNPFDTTVREGFTKDYMPLEFPATLGGDIAGIITQVGSDVTEFKSGDRVYGDAYLKAGSGAFAEFATAKADRVAIAPKNVSFNEAAALRLVGGSALQALTEHINLQSGQKIIILGGSGGIGSVAIQISKNIGAYVAVTVPAEGATLAKELGADEVIDYKAQDFSELLSEYDAVFDTTTNTDLEKSLSVLKPGGIYVSMAGRGDEVKAKEHNVNSINQGTQTTTAKLNALRDLVESGAVKIHVDSVFPLDQIQQAFEKRESGGVNGKIGISIKE